MRTFLGNIYKVRYPKEAQRQKNEIWKVLCQDFLQQFIGPNDSVLDIAAGHCEFINNINCRKKYAIDMDKRIKNYAKSDAQLFICSATNIPKKLTGKIDIVFMGCFLEHLPSKTAIIRVLSKVRNILKKGGKLLILNPNIRFSTAEYWDYFDHLTPVSDRSVVEVLQALGFTIDLCIPRFVPNTIKDRLPKWPILVKIYLKLPFLYPIFGKQMFIVAVK